MRLLGVETVDKLGPQHVGTLHSSFIDQILTSSDQHPHGRAANLRWTFGSGFITACFPSEALDTSVCIISGCRYWICQYLVLFIIPFLEVFGFNSFKTLSLAPHLI